LSPRPDRAIGRLLRGLSTLRALTPYGLAAIGLVVLAFTVALWVLSADARREIDALATASADSSQWALAQAEVELLTLTGAVLAAQAAQLSAATDQTDLGDLRSRFDIFYARMQIIGASRIFAPIRADPDAATALGAIEAFLDDWIPLIDGPDVALRAALPRFAAEAQALRAPLRRVVLTSVRVFAETTRARRARVASALGDLALIATALFLVLLGTVLALVLSLAGRRRQTARIAAAKSRLRAMVDTSLDGILVVDRAGRVLEFNGAARRIFGYTPEEAIGRPMADLIVPDHLRAAHERAMAAYLDTGRKTLIDAGLVQVQARDKAGRVFPVELSLSIAQSDAGEVLVSYIRDISTRVAIQRDLVAARDRALAGEQAKAELLALMSHEMRTPLNGLIGSLDLLRDSGLSDAQQQLVEGMERSGHVLLEQVNAVLDTAREDAGGSRLTLGRLDLSALMQEVADSLAVQAAARGNHVALSCTGPGLACVIGGRARLRRVMVNLLANAIKFTRDGTITLSAQRAGGGDIVALCVRDTGIGIAEVDHDRIFEDFVTLDRSYTREVEGTGLGLGIVRRLVRAMSGHIEVDSAPGQGSAFRVVLPLPEADPLPTVPVASPDAQRPEVLVVEDNEINRMVVRRMLADLGCDTVEAHDGRDGVEIAARRRFDLILMDISMPRLDGCAAVDMIRTGGGPNTDTPVVALTAHALPGDLVRFRRAGIRDVVVKPVTRARLSAVLAEWLGRADLPGAMVDAANRDIDAALIRLRRLAGGEGSVEEIGALAHKTAGLAAVLGLTALHGALVSIEIAADEFAGDPGEGAALDTMVDDARAAFDAARGQASSETGPAQGPDQ